MEKYKFNTIDEAIDDIEKGRMVILVDDEDRENEGDLCMAAEKVTPEAVNFMARYGRGLICLSLTPERVEELKLPMMTDDNTSIFWHCIYRVHRSEERSHHRDFRCGQGEDDIDSH